MDPNQRPMSYKAAVISNAPPPINAPPNTVGQPSRQPARKTVTFKPNYNKDKTNWYTAVKHIKSCGPIFSESHDYKGQMVDYEECRKSENSLYAEADRLKAMADQHHKNREIEARNDCNRQAAIVREKGHSQALRNATTLFVLNNQGEKASATFNIHGQHVPHAMNILKYRMLTGCLGKNVHDYVIITGKGGGSHGLPKIKLKVIEFLQDKNIPHRVEGGNSGRIYFTLDGSDETIKRLCQT